MNIIFFIIAIIILIVIYIAFDVISNKNLKISSFFKKDMNKFILSIFLTIILILIIAKIIELFSQNTIIFVS